MNQSPPTAQSMYDLVCGHFVQTAAGLALPNDGLRQISEALASIDGQVRLDALVGVVAAMRFAEEQEKSEGAVAGLLGIVLTVIEKTQLSETERNAWAARAAKITGDKRSTVALSDPRPEGTIPAGPMARFTALGKDQSKK